jgi:hypothetical protein
MRRELRQCPVTLTGDSDQIHRKAIVPPRPSGFTYRLPPALPNAKGFRSWTTGTHKLKIQERCDMSTTILIILVLILLLGGGGYYGHSTYGGAGLGGVLGLVLVIAIVVWLVGGLGIG